MGEFDEGFNVNFVMYSPCNLGFFMHFFFIVFLDNFVVLQAYGREIMIGIRTERFGAEMIEVENNWQEAGTGVLEYRISVLRS